MFRTLESTWDNSARRSWTTAASFTVQTLLLSTLLLIPLLTLQSPPQLAWFDPHVLAPPPSPAAPVPPGIRRQIHPSNFLGGHLFQPPSIPPTISPIHDVGISPAPDVSGLGVPGGTGERGGGITGSIGEALPLVPAPSIPAVTHPLRMSNFSEGNLVHRVQPNYPPLARQARIQGTVELRAIISKSGTIERLSVLSGHAMLVSAAIEAVKQWRYRPYLLNGEPIEVETDITVNFMLNGN